MSWAHVRLDEIAESVDYGHTASANDSVDGPKFLRITDIQDGEVDWSSVPRCECSDKAVAAFQLHESDIVFARTGATTGKSFLLRHIPESAVFASYLIRVQPRQSMVYPGYLARYFETQDYWNQIARNSTGTAQGGVNASKLKALTVPLPPLPEQRRIAAILDKADALRAKRREAIAKLDQLLQSVFLDMFGDPVTNPKGWPQKKLIDFADGRDRVNYGVVQPGDHSDGGVSIVRVGDIEGGIVSRENLKQISVEIEAAYARSRLKGNELLISCVGSIGVIAEVPAWAVGFNIARALTRVPLSNPRQRPFVREMLRSSGMQRYFAEKTRTVSQPTLNVEFVKAAPAIVPPAELIERFCSISHKAALIIGKTKAADLAANRLFSSVQQAAFESEL